MKRRIDHLDGIRGILALFVAFSHFFGGAYSWVESPFANAYIAVDCFFILSGFVLTYVYSERLQSLKVSYKRYAWNRLARLWPLHIITMIFAGIVFMFVVGELPFKNPVSSGLESVLLVQGFGSTSSWNWNDPSWSISIELWLSILILPLFFKAKKHYILLIVAGTCYALVYTEVGSLRGNYTLAFMFLRAGLLKGIAGMALGVYVYRKIDAWDGKSNYIASFVSIVCISVVFVFAGLYKHNKYDLLIPIVFSVLIYITVTKNTVVSRVFSLKPLAYLGSISFSVYLLHSPLIWLLNLYIGAHSLPMRFFVFIVITLALASLCHHYFEKPIYNKLKRLSWTGGALSIKPSL